LVLSVTQSGFICVLGLFMLLQGGDGVSFVFLAPTESWEKTDLVLVAVQGAPQLRRITCILIKIVAHVRNDKCAFLTKPALSAHDQ
jgi:hypothetical protein